MCIVCVEWEKGNITYKEADRAFAEIIDVLSAEGAEMNLDHVHRALEKMKEPKEITWKGKGHPVDCDCIDCNDPYEGN